MKLKDFLIMNNFVEELHSISRMSEWSTTITAEDLENTLLIKYGNRDIYFAYSLLDSVKIAFHLYFIYNNKWEQLFSSLEELNDIPLHSHHISKTTEDDTDMTEQTNVSNRVQKEQGYNVDEWIETEGNEDSQTNQTTRDKGMTRSSYQGSLSNIRNNIDRVQQIQLVEVICRDIVSSLCLSIY